VDPEDDSTPNNHSSLNLPERDALLGHLRAMLGVDEHGIERAVFHYLGNKVDAEIFLSGNVAEDEARMADIHGRLDSGLTGDTAFSSVSLHHRIAPK
jgi:hypothetical protein